MLGAGERVAGHQGRVGWNVRRKGVDHRALDGAGVGETDLRGLR